MDADTRFRALFETAYPALRRYARHCGLSADDAHDLVAATLEVAWRRIADVPEDDPLPWLYGVARNLCRNQRRARHRYERLLVRVASRATIRAQQEIPAEDPDAVRRALHDLPAGDQEILRLVAWEGLTPAQVAVALGCSAVAARSRLYRARNRLAAKLGIARDSQQIRLSRQFLGDATRTTLEAPDG